MALSSLVRVGSWISTHKSRVASAVERLLRNKLDERVSVADFGAVADYSLAETSAYTDSTEAFRAAAVWSASTGNPVHIPPAERQGFGYYISGEIPMTPGASLDNPASPGLAARFVGAGKGKTFIFVDNRVSDFVLFSVYTTSGYPTSFGLVGASILPIERSSDELSKGTFLLNSGTNMAVVHDIFVDRGFRRGIDNVNGRSGTWTELTSLRDVWIRYCTEFDLGFRLHSIGPNGEVNVAPYSDSSFAGNFMDNVELEARNGGCCIFIDEKVHLYNSDWSAVMHTADAVSYFIKNKGTRHRSTDRLSFEGEGSCVNQGGYDNMSGSWAIQSTSGVMKFTDTINPFVVNASLIGPVTLKHSSFTTGAPAIKKVESLRPYRNTNPSRQIVGLTGDNIESAGYICYGDGPTKTNGFGILSASFKGKLEDIRLRYLLAASGLYTLDDAWNLDHMSPTNSTGPQLQITKSGYHHGKKGYRYTASASANASSQTVSVQLADLPDDAPFHFSVRVRGTGVEYTSIFVAQKGRNNNNGIGVFLGATIAVGPSSGWVAPGNLRVSDSGLMTFQLTTPVDVSISIIMDGIGNY